MKYNFILIIFIIFIILILINYLFSNKENFLNVPVGYCDYKGKVGFRMYDGLNADCESMESKDAIDVENNLQFNELGNMNSNNSNNSNNSSESEDNDNNDNNDNNEKFKESEDLSNSCVPLYSNYGEVCSQYGKNYGIQSKETCEEEEDSVKINCGELIFNGVSYIDEGEYSTGCMDNSLDFDTICNEILPSDIRDTSKKDGYYDRSAGASVILNGKSGDCYNNDGSSNKLKSRAVCNLRSNLEINRIPPFTNTIDYNTFTGCHNMETYTFANECKNLLKLDNTDDVYADIHGFDCMPGYARAKCINKGKSIHIPSDINKLQKDTNSNIYSYNLDNLNS